MAIPADSASISASDLLVLLFADMSSMAQKSGHR
jgi:hypothetical protein